MTQVVETRETIDSTSSHLTLDNGDFLDELCRIQRIKIYNRGKLIDYSCYEQAIEDFRMRTRKLDVMTPTGFKKYVEQATIKAAPEIQELLAKSMPQFTDQQNFSPDLSCDGRQPKQKDIEDDANQVPNHADKWCPSPDSCGGQKSEAKTT